MNPTLLFTFVAVAMLMALLPRVTRPELYFGATVDPDFRRTPEGRAIERRYWLWVAASTIASVALASLASQAAFVPVIAGSTVGWILGNRRARRHARRPEPVREAALTMRRTPRGLVVAALVPLLVLAGTAAYLHFNWDRIPDRFPVHFGLNGPDRWADKSPATVYGILGVGAGVCGAVLLSVWMISGARRVAVTGAAGERERAYRMVNLWFLVAVAWMVSLIFAGISIAITTVPSAVSGPWIGAIAVVPVLAILGAMIWFAKRSAGAEGEPVIGDRTPDSSWIWGGVFYWNRDDPALVVEKRFGFGYTLNMARPQAWLLLVALLVPAVIAMVVNRLG